MDSAGGLGLDNFAFGAAITGFLPVKYNQNQYTHTEYRDGDNYTPEGFETAVVLELIDPSTEGFIDTSN